MIVYYMIQIVFLAIFMSIFAAMLIGYYTICKEIDSVFEDENKKNISCYKIEMYYSYFSKFNIGIIVCFIAFILALIIPILIDVTILHFMSIDIFAVCILFILVFVLFAIFHEPEDYYRNKLFNIWYMNKCHFLQEKSQINLDSPHQFYYLFDNNIKNKTNEEIELINRLFKKGINYNP